MNQSRRFVMAADIGQSNDYTALAILDSYRHVERAELGREPHEYPRRHDLVHLERFRELPYPEQVARIAERYAELTRYAERLRAPVNLVVDATGVGKPILDTLREAGLKPRGIIITGGETASRSGGVTRVPKRELVTTLQVALQAGRLRIAEELPLADALLSEFRGFRVKISLSGHAKFGNDVGSWREADHDDLVLAVSLGVWTLESPKRANLAEARGKSGLAYARS